MRIKFFILNGKSDYPSIHVRIWDSKRIDQKTKTGLKVNRNDWNPKKERVRLRSDSPTKDFINTNLEQLSRKLADTYIMDYNGRKHISSSWLKEQVQNHFGHIEDEKLGYKIYFTDWIDKYIKDSDDKLYRGKPISERTIQDYKTTWNKLLQFEKKHNTKLRHESIDLKFYRKWVKYLREVDKLSDNSIGGHISNIKLWAKNIDIEGLPISREYRHSEFMTITAKTYDVYLNEDEIEMIKKADLKGSERLENTRDLFLIGLRTGLRISDFMRLEKFNIDDDQIKTKTKKTGEDVIIPMHKDVKKIIKKYDGLPKAISDQKFNLYVKELCGIAEITNKVQGAKMVTEGKGKNKITRKKINLYHKNELISSHTCRRSFATNLYGKLPNMTIMAITGHKTEAQFLKYLKTSKQEHADKLKELWETK
ncbi:tyrosine-type recombinase/integrase [Nonlabens dokdonensis]|uniref:tyrosine-type recombinase/integrase n=1 Tax=Nonlabens dokdonensis TaxID=328515 RepID=UPI0026F3709C|nr:tyrosine-type recombinase/integrase [Nonlabens dokdonensis]